MKLKSLLLAIMACCACFVWADGVPFTLSTSGTNQLTVTYDATSGEYTIVTTGTDPYLSINALTADLPSDSCVLAFDYQCSPAMGGSFQIFFGPTYAESRSVLSPGFAATSEWTNFSKVLKNEISNYSWGSKGSIMRLDWGNASGVTIKLKNLRFRGMTDDEKANYDESGNTQLAKQKKAENLKNYLYNNAYNSSISYVAVDADKVTVSGHYAGNGTFSLVEVMPSEDVTEINAFPHRTALTDKDFSVSLNRYDTRDGFAYDRLLSKWAIVETVGGKDTLVSYARYADEAPALSSPAALVPANKKGVGAGLGSMYMNDLVALNAKNITCNWVLPVFIAQNPIFGNNIEYTYGGKKYYINGGEIAAWDNYLTFYEQHGIAVSAILLITPGASDGTMSSVFCHPEYSGGNYSMPNMTTTESINAYAAVLNYLASRYNGSGHGRIEHWIMHNEVDMGTTWTNMGTQPELVYLDTYMKSMRLCYNIVRQYDQNASILGSYTHSWTYGADNYATKTMLEQTVRYSDVEGDFWWGVAHHPYPQDLTKPDFWKNDLKATNTANSYYVTFRNLEVINEWILDESHFYQGTKKRNLFLSENGTNSPSYSESDLAHQAAGACWAWKKTNALDGIDAFMWHNWMDNRAEDGLRIGLHYFSDDETNPGGCKPVWYVWQAAGTEQEDSIMDPYKEILEIEQWRDIFMLVEAEGRNFVSNKSYIVEAEDYDEGGLGVAYSARQATTGDYRTDGANVYFGQGASYSNGWGLFDMGADWQTYSLGKYVDSDAKTITREMAQENWGSWYNYTITAEEPLEVNIYVHHGAAWNQWGVAAGTGLAPGSDTYVIADTPELNWPKYFAGAMVLSIDGRNIATTQTARPIAPEAYQARGTNFNKILTNTDKWTSTLYNGALQTDTLWLWPLAGGNNTSSAYYNDEPDYKSIHLSQGTHTLRVTSLCGPWNFDCLKFDCYTPTAVRDITASKAATLKAYGAHGILSVESDEPATIYSLTGRAVATLPAGGSSIAVPQGIYIIHTKSKSAKVIVK